ncbi:MAG: hypothetical protein IMF26_04310 [Candidatus Fermentithermobacillus carboniphilus]|uniref:Uncharacterized protein n=1 Tax=Candidatus Fermentithermobacillus carboniphilus TaxID=3085328 RepID=A0AAT9LE48_9FIRM|nr:MAG: hypothetical protein IMF26_04310 [Candidatus Fermentithermobacillus carboniphilus]
MTVDDGSRFGLRFFAIPITLFVTYHDGSVSFNITGSYRIRGIQDGDLVIELADVDVPRTFRIDPETGGQSAFNAGEFAGPWELRATRYLLSLSREEAGVDRAKPKYLFKAEGEIGLFQTHVYPVQNFGSSGEVTKTSYPPK